MTWPDFKQTIQINIEVILYLLLKLELALRAFQQVRGHLRGAALRAAVDDRLSVLIHLQRCTLEI